MSCPLQTSNIITEMRTQTFTKLRNTESKRAKFKIRDKAVVRYVHADDSNKLRERVGQTGVVIGFRRYYGGPGNRYYLEFADGYVAGFESWLLKNVSVGLSNE